MPAVLVIGLVLGALFTARPATAEDAQPTASTIAADLAFQTIDLAFLSDLKVGQSAPLSATASSGLPVAFTASGACRAVTVKGALVAVAAGAGVCDVTATPGGRPRYAPAAPWSNPSRSAVPTSTSPPKPRRHGP